LTPLPFNTLINTLNITCRAAAILKAVNTVDVINILLKILANREGHGCTITADEAAGARTGYSPVFPEEQAGFFRERRGSSPQRPGQALIQGQYGAAERPGSLLLDGLFLFFAKKLII
jgi:hypothetical protein